MGDIYRCSGSHAGYITYEGDIYTSAGSHVGYITNENDIYTSDGSHAGYITSDMTPIHSKSWMNYFVWKN